MDQPPPFFAHLLGYYSMVMVQLAPRSGLLDQILEKPGTATELAAAAGIDERNAAELLRGLTVAGYLTCEDGTFAATDLTSLTFGPDFMTDARGILGGLSAAARLEDRLVEVVRFGGGLSAPELGSYAPFRTTNTATYRHALVEEWIGGVPGLADRLAAGGRVADVAGGNGDAAAIIGAAFPASRVTAYDGDPSHAGGLPSNVELAAADAIEVSTHGTFDLITCLDSLHHMNAPERVVAQLRSALAPGGVLLVAEGGLSGDLAADAANPMATITYAGSVIYCLQEALSGGTDVHSAGESAVWVADAMTAAGLTDVSVRHSPTGMAVVTGHA